MKKRVFLVLALGFSFTPAVFSAQVLKVGEMTQSQINPLAKGCNLRDKPVLAESSSKGFQGQAHSGSAR